MGKKDTSERADREAETPIPGVTAWGERQGDEELRHPPSCLRGARYRASQRGSYGERQTVPRGDHDTTGVEGSKLWSSGQSSGPRKPF